jgi:hypothetical protein
MNLCLEFFDLFGDKVFAGQGLKGQLILSDDNSMWAI